MTKIQGFTLNLAMDEVHLAMKFDKANLEFKR